MRTRVCVHERAWRNVNTRDNAGGPGISEVQVSRDQFLSRLTIILDPLASRVVPRLLNLVAVLELFIGLDLVTSNRCGRCCSSSSSTSGTTRSHGKKSKR